MKSILRNVAAAFAASLPCGPAVAAIMPPDVPDQKLPPQIAAVQKYILDKDYPEVFAGREYRAKIQDMVTADLDGDGQTEVIVHYIPHYQQSATIVIYRVAQDLSVTRVMEGLAPGPLQPVSGEFIDSHTVKGSNALDMTAGDQQSDARIRRQLTASIIKQGLSTVEYVNFSHLDSRTGPASFIDMTGLAVPPKSDTCEDFEFSQVRQIGTGAALAPGGGSFLAAWVQAKVYLYRIKSFAASGMLEKEMWTVDVPEDFNGFAPSTNGALRYLTKSGAQKPFDANCTGHQCRLSP